jgi:hypothetical protein
VAVWIRNHRTAPVKLSPYFHNAQTAQLLRQKYLTVSRAEKEVCREEAVSSDAELHLNLGPMENRELRALIHSRVTRRSIKTPGYRIGINETALFYGWSFYDWGGSHRDSTIDLAG